MIHSSKQVMRDRVGAVEHSKVVMVTDLVGICRIHIMTLDRRLTSSPIACTICVSFSRFGNMGFDDVTEK